MIPLQLMLERAWRAERTAVEVRALKSSVNLNPDESSDCSPIYCCRSAKWAGDCLSCHRARLAVF